MTIHHPINFDNASQRLIGGNIRKERVVRPLPLGHLLPLELYEFLIVVAFVVVRGRVCEIIVLRVLLEGGLVRVATFVVQLDFRRG